MEEGWRWRIPPEEWLLPSAVMHHPHPHPGETWLTVGSPVHSYPSPHTVFRLRGYEVGNLAYMFTMKHTQFDSVFLLDTIDTMPSMDSLHNHSLLILSLVHLPIHLHVWHTCMPSMDFFIIIHVWHSCMPSMSVSRPGANSSLSPIYPEFDYLDSYHLLKEELLEDSQAPRGSSSRSSFSKW